MLLYRSYCVYDFKFQEKEYPSKDHSDFQFRTLTPDLIKHFFSEESQRMTEFLAFLQKSYSGFALTKDERLVSYGWVADCSHRMPPHIGNNLRRQASWIFYCGTYAPFRGQGGFRFLLNQIIAAHSIVRPLKPLYIDTRPTNLVSRRAVLSAGFHPAGILRSVIFFVPRYSFPLLSSWNALSAHKKLPSVGPVENQPARFSGDPT
jgi:RimJ/RimL family protein N-acetyltransferase